MLGPRGRLGVAARLFGPDGALQHEITFNPDDSLPMASTAKIAIAMLVADRVAKKELAFEQRVTIHPKQLAPGMARSPIDHLFYFPFNWRRTETIHRLLGFMMHHSDNTSTDALLELVGGVPAVSAFLRHAGIRGIHIKRTFTQLVQFYFGVRLPADRRPNFLQILGAIRQLRPPFVSREANEEALIASGEDCCTPRAMADLLCVIATQAVYAPVYWHMQRCAGGAGRIYRGLAGCRNLIESFGHKTGGMGGVANDAGIVKFKDGSWAAICIMTSRSTRPIETRNQLIAAATRIIVEGLHDVRLVTESHSR